MSWISEKVGHCPKTLKNLCVAAAQKHDVPRDGSELPATLIEEFFDECCFGDDLDTAFRLRHHECVLKKPRDIERLFFLIRSEKTAIRTLYFLCGRLVICFPYRKKI
jgi:hypothetical protein